MTEFNINDLFRQEKYDEIIQSCDDRINFLNY